MKMHVLLMAGGGVALVALAAAGLYGAPLATLLLVGLLVLCPLMMLGMMGGSHDHGGRELTPTTPTTRRAGRSRPGSSRAEGVSDDGR